MAQVTQKDIAKALNLSRVTVTKALKDHPDIAEETKAKIKQLAEELGYTPNYIARSLSLKRTNVIGVIVPKIAHSFFASSIEFIYKAASLKGFDIIPMISFEDFELEKKHIESLLAFRVDGLLVDTSQNIDDASIYHKVRNKGIPLVFFDRALEDNRFSRVTVNDHGAALRAVEFAIQQGYTKIAHFSGNKYVSIGKDRYEGYCEALKKYGLQQKDDWLIEGGFTSEYGYNGLKELVKKKSMPELIFTVNDSVAVGVYEAAKELSLKIPDNIGVIGFGDIEHSQLLNPPLTSVHMPIDQIASEAVNLLVNEILGEEPGDAKEIILPTELKIRGSTRVLGN